MISRLHLCFLLAIAALAGGLVDNIVFDTPSDEIVALRQLALDADEEIHRLNQELSDQQIATSSAITYLEEEKIRLLSLLPNVPAPCYFPDRRTE
jgi:hypothetical protein